MIDARRLALLPQGAILINVARGPLVVENDLVDAHRVGPPRRRRARRHRSRAARADSPLWDLPNVIITPHVGGQAATRIDDMTNFFCDNLARYRAGGPLRNLVDKELGFPLPEADQAAENGLVATACTCRNLLLLTELTLHHCAGLPVQLCA